MNGKSVKHGEVSVLICTRDRREMLDLLLDDLRRQEYPGGIEIVVVEECDHPRPPKGVVYVSHPRRNLGIAHARNLAIEHASHELIAFVDDDCRVGPEWLVSLTVPFLDDEVLGVQGGVTVPDDTNAIGWSESILGFPGGGIGRIHQAGERVMETIEVSTLNAAYRKAAVRQAGGFAIEARYGGEDDLLAKRVAEHGRLLFVSRAVVMHQARGRLPAIWRWFVRRGRAEYELWNSGQAPETFGRWLLRSSLTLKLLPFLLLLPWSIWPLAAALAVVAGVAMWRYRWVLGDKKIPAAAWWWLPWVRIVMSLASDTGRVLAWLKVA